MKAAFYVPKHVTTTLWVIDLVLFVFVHIASTLGVWSDGWDDPIESLYLQAQLQFLVVEKIATLTYTQITSGSYQLNLPESVNRLLWVLFCVRMYTSLVMVTMATDRLGGDTYSLPAAQQVYVSMLTFAWIGVRILFHLNVFESCQRKLKPVHLDCDPRTGSEHIKASMDGEYISVHDKDSGVVHIRHTDRYGQMDHYKATPYSAMKNIQSHAVTPARCSDCHPNEFGSNGLRCRKHTVQAVAGGKSIGGEYMDKPEM